MKKSSVADLEAAFQKTDCQVIDVREPAEFESERIDRTASLPLSSLNEAVAAKLRKDLPLYVLCRSGMRACQAAERLERFGFSDVRVIEGGLKAWSEAGKDVVRGTRRVWAIDRQVRFAAGSLVMAGIVLSIFIHPYWIGLSAFVAAGLIFSGLTDWCGMAMLLARMPWNRARQ